MRYLHLVHHLAPAQDPGSWFNIPIKRLSMGQKWHKPPLSGCENATGLGAERSLLMGFPPTTVKRSSNCMFVVGRLV